MSTIEDYGDVVGQAIHAREPAKGVPRYPTRHTSKYLNRLLLCFQHNTPMESKLITRLTDNNPFFPSSSWQGMGFDV